MSLSDGPFRRIAIIGTGLIGGSWGLALKRSGFGGVRVGSDSATVLRQALAAGAIDRAEEDPRRAVQGADLVILAAPVGAILQLLPQLQGAAAPGALITDTGSTKAMICRESKRIFGGSPLFLGGHPMAGRERSGVEYADEALFEDACYVLTPTSEDDLSDRRVIAFRDLAASLGARVLIMDAALHDQAVGWLSHLPQLASTALASVIEAQPGLPLDVAASGFRDATRLAESPYLLWRDICATNRENIRQSLDAFIAKLQTLRDHLADETLEREFEQAQKLRLRMKA
ncbi:MAG TPA: prephenate dehydrogenase/arogenate dehydrogenase family protein [Terriglobia bacterium]|nr:prephenate dehydrogenase/arogenate dehydrogenase family protein [Terriglobia bacterium]